MNDAYRMSELVLLIKREDNKERILIAREDYENKKYYLISESGEELIKDKEKYSIVRAYYSSQSDSSNLRYDLAVLLHSADCYYMSGFYLCELNDRKTMIDTSKEMNIFFKHLMDLKRKIRSEVFHITRENINKLEEKLNFDLQYIPITFNKGLNEEDFDYLKSQSDNIRKNIYKR